MREAAEQAGLASRVDPAGNLYLTLPGTDPTAKRIVIGIHLDSVAEGVDYDGTAGVLARLAVAVGQRKAGITPRRAIEVMAIRSEEGGAWFPTPFPGSRAALGLMEPEALPTPRIDGSISLHVTASDRDRLLAIIDDRNSPQKHVWRARIVLLTAGG